MRFESRLRELRKSKRLTQKQLAEKTSLAQSSISAWELGERQPLASQLILLARFFECSIDYILYLD